MVDFAITFALTVMVLLMVLNLGGLLLWVERKGSAVLQDRIGANRAAIFGRLPFNLGIVNTLIADPIKLFTKENFVPHGADKLLHTLAPIIALVPVLMTFIVIPFGDVLIIGERVIPLQAADLNVGLLYILAMVSLGVYGVVLGGWASNNRWALLGGIRGSAQMISYEIPMGLSLVAVVMTFGSLNLQEIARAQGQLIGGWIPAWGILYQPVAFLIFMAAGIAESKRVPFDLPEAESELISGYFTEYSGAKQATFMLVDFIEVIIVAGLVTTLFFGGWQVPFLLRDGFHFPWGTVIPLPSLVVALLQVGAFTLKVLFFCWLQIMIRWTLPRFRYDQLMNLGWKGLIPLSLANVMLTALLLLLF
ncbi:MAG: NADH-quinone oxidoreductase subunit NuoH [Candidatus Binatia bacterium]|nr:NADH-quinone oxidoreductase subunit NuoH [Candidatus Binatia bacterium]